MMHADLSVRAAQLIRYRLLVLAPESAGKRVMHAIGEWEEDLRIPIIQHDGHAIMGDAAGVGQAASDDDHAVPQSGRADNERPISIIGRF